MKSSGPTAPSFSSSSSNEDSRLMDRHKSSQSIAKPTPISSLAVLRTLISFCSTNESLKILLGFVSLGVNSVTNLSFPSMIGTAIDQVNSDNYRQFMLTSASYFLVGSIASWIRVYCFGTATDSISSRLRQRLFESYLDKDMEYFDGASGGEMITLLEDDVNEAAETLTETMASGARSLSSAVNGSFLLYATSPTLCAVSLSVVPLVGVGAMLLSKYTSTLAKRARSLQSETTSFCLERLSNLSTVKLNSREKHEKSLYKRYMDLNSALSEQRCHARGAFMAFINIATNTSLVAVLGYGGKLLADGSITPGVLTRFAIQSAFVGLGFSGLATFYSDLKKSLEATSRVFHVIEDNKITSQSSRATSYRSTAAPLLVTDVSSSNLSSIHLVDVSFSYASRPEVLVLSNVSATIRPASITCFIGKSGSGKSTLVGVLSGLLVPQKGCIVVSDSSLPVEDTATTNDDDDDAVRAARSVFYGEVGVVQQVDRSLFSGTIADNIAYGKENVSVRDIQAAARSSAAHDFIMSLPNQYETEVGVGGALLSGGQRARVALARALVKDPKYLILDEPTANLDPENELQIFAVLSRLRETKSIVVITHSEAFVKVADKVYRLDKGSASQVE